MGYFSTPRSAAAAGGGPGFGAQLYGWNKTDLTEFDGANLLEFAETLAGGPSGTMVPSFVASGFQGQPVIRLTATTILGGSVLTVLPSSLTLPKHYIVQVHIVGLSGSGLSFIMCPFGNDDAGDWRGAVWFRTAGGSGNDLTLTTVGTGEQVLRNSGVNGINPGGDTWNQTLANRGGTVHTFECFRQTAADNPSDWSERMLSQEGASIDRGALSRQDCSGSGDTSPDWDGEDLNLLGIGCLGETSGRTGVVDILDLQVFAAA